MIKMSRKIKKNGFTLIELIVSIMVFSLISIVLGVILNVGLKSWKEVDGKTEAEREMTKAVLDINNSIRNSNISGIKCDDLKTDYKGNGYIVCPSYASYKSLNTNTETYTIWENEFDYSLKLDTSTNTGTGSTGGGTSTDDKVNHIPEFNNNFFVAYFVAKQSSCSLCEDLFGATNDSDICPHRYLIKKWYKGPSLPSGVITNLNDSWSDSILTSLSSKTLSSVNSSKSPFDKILSKNILAFSANKNNAYTVSYYIKIFKPNLNKSKPKTLEVGNSVDDFYAGIKGTSTATVINDKKENLDDYCLQVSSTVAPLNN